MRRAVFLIGVSLFFAPWLQALRLDEIVLVNPGDSPFGSDLFSNFNMETLEPGDQTGFTFSINP